MKKTGYLLTSGLVMLEHGALKLYKVKLGKVVLIPFTETKGFKGLFVLQSKQGQNGPLCLTLNTLMGSYIHKTSSTT